MTSEKRASPITDRARDVRVRLPRLLGVIAMADAKGPTSEAYAAGYADAMQDIEAILQGKPPPDKWGFWRKATEPRS